jgi:hypothetical protein
MMPEYFTDLMARDRLAELRALAARQSLLRDVRASRPPMRVVLGTALVRLGRWLMDKPHGAVVAERRSPA